LPSRRARLPCAKGAVCEADGGILFSLPRGEGGFFGFAEKDERGITKFPVGKASLII